MADKVADKDFTPRELEVMAKAWSCMVEEPKVDYDKLAAACGMGNPRSAANAWRAIKTKVIAKEPSESNDAQGGISKAEDGEANGDSTPKKATPRKRGKAADKTADDGESPTKKAKGGRKGKATQKEEDSAEADAEEEEDGKVKKEDEGEEGGGDLL